ncbi:MAG TPA: hypothetical protein VES67_22930 [Vicinamibacterales bacterium]|nr:hypothetical protein [Vicinamibacterales bacterium]
MLSSCFLAVAALLADGRPTTPWAPAEPVVSVWYRGSPAGTPREDDLAAIRAQGFTGVTWPASQPSGAGDLLKMAVRIGLGVSIHAAPVHLTPPAALTPPERIDIVVSRVTPGQIPALVWRAVGRGARAIAFDPEAASGTGLTDASGRPRPWVAPAAAIARNLTFNARLFYDVRAGPSVALQAPTPAGVDVVLLETARAWVLVSTNTSAVSIKGVVDLPPAVAPALWTSLLDGADMSMLSRPSGPQWTFRLGPGEAGVWAIDK